MGSECQTWQCTYHTCKQSSWRFSIQRTSGKRDQKGSKVGENNPFQVWSQGRASEWHVTTQSILGCLNGLLTWCPGMHTWEIREKQQFIWFVVQSQAETLHNSTTRCCTNRWKTLWSPSRKHEGHVLGWDFLGMRLRSDEILIGTTRGVIKTRTLRTRAEEEHWDNEFERSSKGEPRQPVPGINSDHVPAAISDRAEMRLEEDQADARLGQQDEGNATRQTCFPTTFRYVEDNVRHEGAVITKPVTRTHAGTGCSQNWRRVKQEESILPENKHVWMQGNRSKPLHQATNVLCQWNGIVHQKISGECAQRCDNETGYLDHKWCFILQCMQRTCHGHRRSTIQETSCRCSNRRLRG